MNIAEALDYIAMNGPPLHTTTICENVQYLTDLTPGEVSSVLITLWEDRYGSTDNPIYPTRGWEPGGKRWELFNYIHCKIQEQGNDGMA